MSKYSTVEGRIKELLQLGQIEVVERNETRLDMSKDDPMSMFGQIHVLKYWLVPKKTTYSVAELQAWMSGLFPGVEPREKRDFDENKFHFWFGRLVYEEVIAMITENTLITLNENGDDWQTTPGFNEGIWTKEYKRELGRTIRVFLYPDADLARSDRAKDFEETESHYPRRDAKMEVEKKRRSIGQPSA